MKARECRIALLLSDNRRSLVGWGLKFYDFSGGRIAHVEGRPTPMAKCLTTPTSHDRLQLQVERSGTIKLLPHCHHTLASFTGLPHFYLSFAFIIIHGSDLPFLCIIVNTNGTQKWGRPRNDLYIPLICALLFLYSLSPIHGKHLSFDRNILSLKF